MFGRGTKGAVIELTERETEALKRIGRGKAPAQVVRQLIKEAETKALLEAEIEAPLKGKGMNGEEIDELVHSVRRGLSKR